MKTIVKLQSAARTALATGEYNDAAAIQRRVLLLIGNKYGTTSSEYAHCVEEIAEICELKNEWAVAEELHKEAAAAYRTQHDTSQATIALVLRKLAEVCRQQGKSTDAKQFDMEAAAIVFLYLERTRNDSAEPSS